MKFIQKRSKSIACLMMAFLLLSLSACAAEHNSMANDSYDGYAPNAPNASKGDYSYGYTEDSVGEMIDGDFSYTTSDDVYVPEAPSEMEPTDSASPVRDSARKLIKNVSMDLETLTFDEFMADLYNRIAAVGGYVQSSSENAGGYNYKYAYMRQAYVTARIPADRLDAFCSGVEGTCNVVSRRENANDVTLQYYDTESHMRALQSEYDTLVGILEKCTKLEDVISVQRRITDVLYQIESYKTTLNNYDNLVSYSTVTMNISEVKEETVVAEQTLGERISSGFRSTMTDMREGAEDFAVGFVANLPYIVIWAVIILACVFAVKAIVRRARNKRRAAVPQMKNDMDNKEN